MDSEITQTTPMYDFLGWLDTHKKALIQASVAAAVVAVGVYYWIWSSGQSELQATTRLITLQMDAAKSGGDRGELLRQFAEDNASTRAGGYALLLSGGVLFSEGKYAESQSAFEQFLAKSPDSPFTVQADYGVACALEAQGKAEEALSRYEIVARETGDPLAERAKMAVARIQLERNQPAEALRLYRQVAGMSSPLQVEAQLRASEVIKQHPELGGTNTTNAASSAPILAPSN